MQIPAVNNDLYRQMGHAWWDENVGEFSSIRFLINPVRFGYFKRILDEVRGPSAAGLTLLDVGCGGGLLAEEFARAGLRVTGVDPASESLAAARAHATASGLAIDYREGRGEGLPFADAAFDVVICCDVLEHVDDVERVVAEVARVLKPGGLFFFDTINRTLESRIAVIKVMQEWRSTAFVAANCHVWERFITPAELRAILTRHGLEGRGLRGLMPRCNPLAGWLNLRRRAKGQISFAELGRRLAFGEADHLHVSYMGYAERTAAASPPK